MIKKTIALFFAMTMLYILTAFKKSNPFDTVLVEGGKISGTLNSKGDIHIFKGISFAAPPVGELRWKAPEPVKPWTGIKICDHFGPSPMQSSPVPFSMWSQEFLIPQKPISEDCLYLNVWTRAKSLKENRPVLVWIYGGGFSSGGAGVPIYDGNAMAEKGIVFVSFNYRVGIFGFFAHPDLTKESPHNISGNYGLLDQIAALKWVQNNIGAFGGDPRNVTIAGQSAGSMSINILVASPLAKNLFQKAIGESGANFTRENTTLQKAEEQGEKTMSKLSDSSIVEMRSIPAETLMKKAPGNYSPVIDGYVLPASVATIFKEGKENKVPLLTGWNEDEGLIFGQIKNAADYKKQIQETYGAMAKKLLYFYPAANDSEAKASQEGLSRDIIFGVQNYTWANMESAHGARVYVYRFMRKPPATGEYKKYGAFHTAEVPYAYDNLKFVNRPWEQVDYKLAKIMSSYWANFVKSGNPNSDGLPVWPAYSADNKKIMMLGKIPRPSPLPDKDALDFLYSVLNKE